MKELRQLLQGNLEAAAYLLHTDLDSRTIMDQIRSAAYNAYYLDGSGISDEREFFEKTQRVLAFPDYFGNNWDAFDDCITDLSWVPPARGNVIFYDAFENFAKSNPEQFKLAYYGLGYAARRNTAPLPCYVLFRGDENYLPERLTSLKG